MTSVFGGAAAATDRWSVPIQKGRRLDPVQVRKKATKTVTLEKATKCPMEEWSHDGTERVFAVVYEHASVTVAEILIDPKRLNELMTRFKHDGSGAISKLEIFSLHPKTVERCLPR